MPNEKWVSGYGDGLTGPTTLFRPVCGGDKWPTFPVSCGKSTIAIMVAQEKDGTRSPESEDDLIKRSHLVASAPALLEALESAIKTAEMENYPLRPWRIKAHAAIAAAKGE